MVLEKRVGGQSEGQEAARALLSTFFLLASPPPPPPPPPPPLFATFAPFSRASKHFSLSLFTLFLFPFSTPLHKKNLDRDGPGLRRSLHPPLVPDGRADVPDDGGEAPVEGDRARAGGLGEGGGGRSRGGGLGGRGRRRGVVDSRDRCDALQ